MKNKCFFLFLILISISSLLMSEDIGKDELKTIKLPDKPIKEFTEKEIIYFGSFLFGYSRASNHKNIAFIKMNLDQVILGFQDKMKNSKLEIDSNEFIGIRNRFKKASVDKKNPDQKDIDRVSYIQGIQDAAIFTTDPVPLDKKAFVIGILYAKNLKAVNISNPKQASIFKRLAKMGKIIQKNLNNKVKKEEKIFLANNAKKNGIVTLPSGLQYKIIKSGTGISFEKGTIAKLNYKQFLHDGTIIDDTYKSNAPWFVHFNDKILVGLREALALMNKGSLFEIYIPGHLAYNGKRTKKAGVNPYSTLIYHIEILELFKTTDFEYLEKNKNKKGVITLKSGLQYKVIKKGTGDIFAKGQNADVHYEGRLVDGTIFETSYKKEKTINVLQEYKGIKGWREILKLMRKGDMWEVTIPSELAYGHQGTPPTIKPHATLIFKLEIMQINNPK